VLPYSKLKENRLSKYDVKTIKDEREAERKGRRFGQHCLRREGTRTLWLAEKGVYVLACN
jgi:hypothetical protein